MHSQLRRVCRIHLDREAHTDEPNHYTYHSELAREVNEEVFFSGKFEIILKNIFGGILVQNVMNSKRKII